MFYWQRFMVEEAGLDARLSTLSVDKSIAFAAACTRHAILPFEALRVKHQYTPSRPDALQLFLEVIDKAYASRQAKAKVDIYNNLYNRLDTVVGSQFRETMGYNEGELLNATDQTLECLKTENATRRASLAAKSSYNAVSKWYVALAFPGKAISADAIIQFEMRSPECRAELAIQVQTLALLERSTALPDTCQMLLNLAGG